MKNVCTSEQSGKRNGQFSSSHSTEGWSYAKVNSSRRVVLDDMWFRITHILPGLYNPAVWQGKPCLFNAVVVGCVAVCLLYALPAWAVIKRRNWGRITLLVIAFANVAIAVYDLCAGKIAVQIPWLLAYSFTIWTLWGDSPKKGARNVYSAADRPGEVLRTILLGTGYICYAASALIGFLMCLGEVIDAAGFWGCVVGITVLPVTFVAAPWYDLLRSGNWTTLAVCYGGIILASTLVWIAGALE